MKKFWKKAAAAAMASLMLLGTAGCSSEDLTWAARRGEDTVPIGAYIYYLFTAYNDAVSQVEDSTQSILSQTVEGQDASSWITERAMQYTRNLFLLDDRMAEMGLSLTDEEQQQIENTANTQWAYMGSMLENDFGIAKSSYQLAGPEYITKYAKIFDATYGRDGTSPVPDEEVENYFEENYTSYAYIIRPLYHTADTSGETSSSSSSESTSSASSESSSSTGITAMTEEEIAAAEQEFDDFAAKITSGEMTAQQAADQYKEAAGLEAEQLTEGVEMISTETGAPEELVTLLDSLDAGEAGTTEVSLGTQKAYLLAVKYDISQETQTALEDETTYETILAALRGEEFGDMINEAANQLEGIEINQDAVNSYTPSMFE